MHDTPKPTRPTFAAIAALAKGDIENAIVAATPGGIEAQEKAGQTTFVANSTLPIRMFDGCSREALQTMGIRIGSPVDDLFVTVTLPPGWKKQATAHPMWSDLIDDQDRRRAVIFYKAAFYDRTAHISLSRRYTYTTYRPCDAEGGDRDDGEYSKTVVLDINTVIHEVGFCGDREFAKMNALEQTAIAWLDAHFPAWRDPLAYWD